MRPEGGLSGRGAGAQIGRYRVLDEVARGGAGVVFRARHPDLDRSVALKLLLGRDRNSRSVQRLLQEAKAMSRLRHPNIVPVHEIAEHEGQPFLVMDFVEGESLEQQLSRGPLQPARAAAVARDVARAVAHAHRQGILHRDVKPGNVLVRPDGAVLLTDFGLAKDLEAPARLSVTGVAMGTPGYWAPEQALGDLTAIDARTDVYGLGGVLYSALTGEPPVQADSLAEAMIAASDRPPTPPGELAPGVPPALEAICLKALEKRPQDRFATAAELAGALDRFLSGDPSGPKTLRRWAPIGALLLAVVVAAAAVGVRVEQVERSARAARAVAAGDVHTWTGRGLAHFHRGDLEAASKCFRRAQELQPGAGMPSYWLGMVARQEEAWADADRLFCLALEQGVEHSQVHFQRGYVRYYQARYQDALADFNAFLAAAPNDASGLAARGTVRLKLRDLQGALADLSASLALDPRQAETLAMRAFVHYQMGSPQRAIRDADRALTVNGRCHTALLHRGLAFAKLGRLERAERDLDQALRIEQKDIDLWLARGLIRMNRKAPRAAFQDFDQAVRIKPTSGLAYANRAVARRRMGDLLGARDDLKRALEHPNPNLNRDQVEAALDKVEDRIRRR